MKSGDAQANIDGLHVEAKWNNKFLLRWWSSHTAVTIELLRNIDYYARENSQLNWNISKLDCLTCDHIGSTKIIRFILGLLQCTGASSIGTLFTILIDVHGSYSDHVQKKILDQWGIRASEWFHRPRSIDILDNPTRWDWSQMFSLPWMQRCVPEYAVLLYHESRMFHWRDKEFFDPSSHRLPTSVSTRRYCRPLNSRIKYTRVRYYPRWRCLISPGWRAWIVYRSN